MLQTLPADKRAAETDGPLALYGQPFRSRLLLGTALYTSPDLLVETVAAAQPGLLTVSLRRELAQQNAGRQFHDLVLATGIPLLPNTAGCRTASEAITTAEMARELFGTSLVKLEVIANDDTLQPEVFGLVDAATELTKRGFQVLPYTTDDLSVAERLLLAGCEVLMPWGAPIGSGQGLVHRRGLATLRAYFPAIPLIVDAGLGAPSHAAEAMELGYDAVLLNTAIAKAGDPPSMGAAFAQGVAAGRLAYLAGLMPARDMAVPSTPVVGTPFFDQA